MSRVPPDSVPRRKNDGSRSRTARSSVTNEVPA